MGFELVASGLAVLNSYCFKFFRSHVTVLLIGFVLFIIIMIRGQAVEVESSWIEAFSTAKQRPACRVVGPRLITPTWHIEPLTCRISCRRSCGAIYRMIL